MTNLYWPANLHEAATCRCPEGGRLMEVQLYKGALIWEKNFDPFARANSARACSNCLALTEFIQLGDPKCLYGKE